MEADIDLLDIVVEEVVEEVAEVAVVGVVEIFLLEGDVFPEEFGDDVVVMFENVVVPEGSRAEVVVPFSEMEVDFVAE